MRKRKFKRLKVGDWNLIDDRSGFKIKASEAVFDEDLPGVITTRKFADKFDIGKLPRPPFPTEGRALPFTRPEVDDVFGAEAAYVWNNSLKRYVMPTDDSVWSVEARNWEDIDDTWGTV